jgi:hypothetical protein
VYLPQGAWHQTASRQEVEELGVVVDRCVDEVDLPSGRCLGRRPPRVGPSRKPTTTVDLRGQQLGAAQMVIDTRIGKMLSRWPSLLSVLCPNQVQVADAEAVVFEGFVEHRAETLPH